MIKLQHRILWIGLSFAREHGQTVMCLPPYHIIVWNLHEHEVKSAGEE